MILSRAIARRGMGLRPTSALNPKSFASAKGRGVSFGRASLSTQLKGTTRMSTGIQLGRAYSTEAEDGEMDPTKQERMVEEADVVIVGGGPSGLSAAIRIKQNALKQNKDIRVVVLEKGPEIGAHILSGAVIEPGPLEELFPNWEELGAPLLQPALEDHMKFLTKNYAIPIPHPPTMSNHGNYIVSLSDVVKWLGERAEELEVEIFAGFAGSEVIYGDKGQVVGVATNDVGLDKNFKPKPSFERGIEIHGKVTLFAEGCHGSLSKQVINKYSLRDKDAFQAYGLGLKEVWEIDPAKHKAGTVVHTVGFPFSSDLYAGSFIYHMKD
ncbi:Electron transfer flavoprotein-ubiquinone oxidoreductase, mitochondrial, partial [Zancudomyces culisetae]